ncbi:MAG: hypothetical protein HDQ87_07230 [Clostridia bacterium]|nr:hypothetical protein [Clostridia bacterium]
MKKTFALALIVVIVLGTCTVALAVNRDFSFVMTAGGASDYSYATYKSDGENRWYVTPKSSQDGTRSNWFGGNPVRFRVRYNNNARDAASELYLRREPNYGNTFSYPYSTGCAEAGKYYRLYADVPYGGVSTNLVGTWCP